MSPVVIDIEHFVRELLWEEHPYCCGSPVVGAEYMGQREINCCGCPESALLTDAQIVAKLRTQFPEPHQLRGHGGVTESDASAGTAEGTPASSERNDRNAAL